MRIRLMEIKEAVGCQINNPNDVLNAMREEARADRECIWVVHLNTQGEIIEKELVSMGTLNSASVHPREVFRKAVMNSSDSIIVTHNHPSGSLKPSHNDVEVKNRLCNSGDILGIKVKDFIIISPKGVKSALDA